ncbi:MAG: phage head-tail connector protein [Rhodanobacter sp.]
MAEDDTVPDDADLCAVADVQAYLNLSSNQDNALLQTLITNASAFIDNYCNRTLLSNVYTETRNGTGGESMSVRQFPVTAITSLTIDGQTINPATSFHTPGFVWDEDMIYLRGGLRFCRGAQNVTFTYTAGMSSVPADINQACVEIVALKYKRRLSIEVSSKTLNGEVISFNNTDMPASAKSTLANYKRVFLG